MSATDSGRLARRLTIYAVVGLVLQVLALVIWGIRFYVLKDWTAPMLGYDFSVFWSAARVALEHNAAAVFSAQWMQPMEESLRHQVGYSPWPYPPTFLLAVVLFGLLPFGGALVLYFVLGLSAFGAMLARISHNVERAWLPWLAAFPGVPVALGLGQNSLLTVSAAGAALALLETNAGFAGMCIALLVIKPQFGVLFPLALVCSRQWKALVVAALCTLAFAGGSVAVFGVEAWRAFAAYLPEFSRIAVEQGGREMWLGMPTVFALSRSLGLSVSAAYVVHGLVAAPAVMVMAFLWVKRARFELRATAFVVATLLIQPYIMFYDLVWMILPIVFLMRDARVQALSRLEWVLLAAVWLAPVQGVLAAYVGHYLQVLPAVLVAFLAIVMRRHFASTAAHSQPATGLGGHAAGASRLG
ncbi:glycosyltransferase family 87 protein [Ralstonia sp. A12]|uniref:glycosyltransferase family 87 protein n=1 Tax=Ralstonia sp. A12 TaxID=1217052 RepID=UPI000A023376|nr:glycosyltransferase family 87 protein [Ralstonia sp. A12]